MRYATRRKVGDTRFPATADTTTDHNPSKETGDGDKQKF